MNERMRTYREEQGITQTELATELNETLGTHYSKPHISQMENGVVGTPQKVNRYLTSKTSEKAVITSSDARKDGEWVTMPHDKKKSLKSPISKICYERLLEASREHPLDSYELARELGISEPGIRAAIREIRMAKIRVCSAPSQKGYWLEEKGGGYEVTRNQLLSRAFRILEVVRAMDDAKDGQYEWVKELGSIVTYGATPRT